MEPLVRLLQLANGDGSTTAYLQEAMEKAHKTVKACIDSDPSRYAKIEELFEKIDGMRRFKMKSMLLMLLSYAHGYHTMENFVLVLIMWGMAILELLKKNDPQKWKRRLPTEVMIDDERKP